MIALENVAKSFDGRRALEPTSLIFPRLIIGLIPPDAGNITIDGTEMTRETARGLRRRIGYVIRERIERLAERVGLETAILAAGLALLAQAFFGRLDRILVPRGLRERPDGG